MGVGVYPNYPYFTKLKYMCGGEPQLPVFYKIWVWGRALTSYISQNKHICGDEEKAPMLSRRGFFWLNF